MGLREEGKGGKGREREGREEQAAVDVNTVKFKDLFPLQCLVSGAFVC